MSAGSSTSGRFVAAITMTPSLGVKPSISTRMALSVCSRSSWPPVVKPPPRRLPTASISSRKMMPWRGVLGLLEEVAHARGADADEHLGRSRSRRSRRRGRRPRRRWPWRGGLLPQPGGPVRRTPRGMRPAELGELLGILEELDDLGELVLGLIDAGDVLEGDDRSSPWRGRGVATCRSSRACRRRCWRCAGRERASR